MDDPFRPILERLNKEISSRVEQLVDGTAALEGPAETHGQYLGSVEFIKALKLAGEIVKQARSNVMEEAGGYREPLHPNAAMRRRG